MLVVNKKFCAQFPSFLKSIHHLSHLGRYQFSADKFVGSAARDMAAVDLRRSKLSAPSLPWPLTLPVGAVRQGLQFLFESRGDAL